MKKSKFTLVIVLGLVLCLLCGTTATFSWFNRPGVLQGDSLSWHGDYNVTNGKDITAVTYAASNPDGSEYSTDPFNFNGLQNVSAHETKYFCTEVKNTGAAPQSISLFLNNQETNKLSVGVNSPLRTYRRVTSDSQTTSYVTKTPCNVNKKNVYVGFVTADSYPEIPENFKADRDSLKNGDYFLHCWNGQGAVEAPVNNSFLKKDVEYTPTTQDYSNFKAKYDIYYCTIPYNYNGVKMYKKNTEGGSDWCYGNETHNVDTDNTVLGFYWKGNNQDRLTAAYEQTKVNGELAKAAGISSFYSKAEAVVGKTLDLKVTAQGTVTYKSSKTDVATVDGKGLVTAKKAGKTTITVTSTGVYGDVITAQCELTVSKEPVKSSYIPIVTNMKIEGATDSNPAVTKVYWYIKNDTQNEAKYLLGDVQISL